MPLYFIKPVFWNDRGYERPGGARATSGYPAKFGFGHEEWNNSDKLNFVESGQQLHAFHTEGLGKQKLDQFADRIFVFMIASHDGKQFLVSAAGNATALFGKTHRTERLNMLRKLKASTFSDDAWSVDSVKRAYREDHSKFRRRWRRELNWFANWKCPADLYLGLPTPLAVDPRRLTGRKRLISRYGSYQAVDRSVALRLLDSARAREDTPVIRNLISACSNDDPAVSDDVQRVESRRIGETTKRRLIDARLGQGRFRSELDGLWGHACAVTRCSVREILRASHIKPWTSSRDSERLDSENGLLLAAHLDALFNIGLITFKDSGALVKSKLLLDDGVPSMKIGGRLAKVPSPRMRQFLEFHREFVFRKRHKSWT
jgi:hypothetical protein